MDKDLLIWRVPKPKGIAGALSPFVDLSIERVYVAIPAVNTIDGGFSKLVNYDKASFDVPKGYNMYVKSIYIWDLLSDEEIRELIH